MTYLLIAAAALVPMQSAPPELRGEQLMQALKAGGYTIVVRHARTDRAAPNRESVNYTPQLRSDQRNLSPEGVHDVRLMSEVVRRFDLPIGDIVTSPLYRCRETADAFGAYTTSADLRTLPLTPGARELFMKPAPSGSNRVLVTHHFVIEELVPGIQPGDIGESEAVVIRPGTGGRPELIGRILLNDWQELAGELPEPVAAAAPVHGVAPIAHGAGSALVSAASRQADHYIAAFNRGDAEQMRTFIEAQMVPDAARPIAERVATYTTLFAEHGALMKVGVMEASDTTAAVHVRSQRGDVVVRVRLSPAGKLASVTFATSGGGHR